MKKTIVCTLMLLLSLLLTHKLFTVQPHGDVPKMNQHKKYRNIIFDVGNVLLEWNPTKIVSDVCAKQAGLTIDINSILQFISSEDWTRWDKGYISRKDLETVIPAKLNREAVCAFLDLLPYSLTPLEEGIKIFKTMKERGYHIYILSNIAKESLDIIKQQNNFFELCDGEIFSCNVHVVKPDSAIYKILLESYDLDPAECLFIDDVPKNIDAAKSVGIDGVVCESYASVKDELKRLCVLDCDDPLACYT